MDVTLGTHELLKVLALLKPIAQSRTSIAVLRAVRIVVTDPHRHTIEATDLSTRADLLINSGKPASAGAVVIDHALLVSAVEAAGGASTRIYDRGDGKVEIEGVGKVVLDTLPLTDWPENPWTQHTQRKTITLQANLLADAMDWTVLAVSRDQTRPVLNCLNLELKAKAVTLVATDSYRLHIARVQATHGNAPDGNYLLPLDMARILHKYVAKMTGHVVFEFIFSGDTALAVKITPSDGRGSWTSRLADGQFPTYEKLIPYYDEDLYAVVEIAELKEAVEAIAKVAGKSTSNNIPLRMSIKPIDDERYELTLTFAKQDGVAISRTMPVDVEAPADKFPFEIGLNPGFLKDAVKSKERWAMVAIQPLRPIFYSPDLNMDRQGLLMPIRLDN